MTHSGKDLQEEVMEFLSVALNKPMSADMQMKEVDTRRPTTSQTTPARIDKCSYALFLIQKRKSIIAHD